MAVHTLWSSFIFLISFDSENIPINKAYKRQCYCPHLKNMETETQRLTEPPNIKDNEWKRQDWKLGLSGSKYPYFLLQHTTLFPLKIIIFLCKVCSFQNMFISIFSFEPHKSRQTATQKKAMRPLGLDEVKG